MFILLFTIQSLQSNIKTGSEKYFHNFFNIK